MVTILVAAAIVQIPQTFTNLQILPKDIPRGELLGIMRNVAGDLGVRCTHCHVGPDNLQGMDFATDDKPSKRAARAMMQMVRAMNTDFIRKLPAADAPRMEVTCRTCHKRQTKPPRPLDSILADTVSKSGVPAAIAEFTKMRDQFGHAGLYDFTEATFAIVATRFVDSKRPAEALAVFKAAADLFPKSLLMLSGAANLSMNTGDRAGAETYWKRVLEIDPKNAQAIKALEALKTRPPQ